MTLQQIVERAHETLHAHPAAAILAAAVLGTVTIRKLELPVWQWLVALVRGWFVRLGEILASSLIEEVTRIREDLNKHITEADQREASRIRERILIFSAQLGRGWRHTEEMYVDILLDIDWYEDFCREHDDYKNSRAVAAIHHIRDDYAKRLLTHDFA